MEVTGIILAGGKSLRLGRNKATEIIGGMTLIERVIKSLTAVTNRIILVTAGDIGSISAVHSIEEINDIYAGKGPLSGIYTGLRSSHTISNIVVACDMPFLNTALLEHMVRLLPGFDAIVPRWPNGFIEPLYAAYSISCLTTMKKHLDNKQLTINGCLKEMNVSHFDKSEFSKFDPDFLSFFNINNQADIDFANKLAASQKMEGKVVCAPPR